MSSESTKNDANEIEYIFETELSERELLSIGTIVALWGSLEHEIFIQTLRSFNDSEISQGILPKAMSNMQFSEVLALWERQVVNKAAGERKEVLQKQCESIRYHHDFRNALVHGMWDWSVAAPEKITAIRIRKKEMRSTHFTADDLASFASVLGTINYRVRYPGGLEDYAAAKSEQGAYLSRRAICAMTGHPLADELFWSPLAKGKETPQGSAAEKAELLDTVWESLEADAASLTDEQRAELDFRIARHEQNPYDVIPWQQVRARLHSPSG